MNPRVAQFAGLYKLDTHMIKKALEDVKPDDVHKRLNNTGSSLHWLAGHILNSRYFVANLIGASKEHEFSELFNGGQAMKESSSYPSIEEVQKAFDSISEKLISGLENLSDADIEKKVKEKWPHGDDTQLGAISFMCWHEGWHIGQMSVLRKHLGYKGLAG